MPGWGITRWAADRGNKKPGDLKQSVDLKAMLGNEGQNTTLRQAGTTLA